MLAPPLAALLLAAGAAVLCAPVCEAGTALPRPNIVIMFGDDLGYGDLSCFGHPTSNTTNIDRLAAQGAKIRQLYSAANICSPSRGALMTGRLFRRLGVYPGVFSPLSVGGLPLNETTMPDLLRTVGYATGGLGKWHLGVDEYLPYHRGFDFYFGAPMTQNECVSNIVTPGSATNGSGFGPCPIFNTSRIVEQGHVDMLEIDDRYDAAMAGFIRGAVARAQKFFFYFASHHVHAPQFTPQELADASIRGLFGDSLNAFDRSVGRLMDLLDELGQAENTLIVLSSDNGGSLHWHELGGVNGDLRCGKGTTFEGGQRVPGIVRWPASPGIRPGSVITDVMSNLDWVQTFAALTGYKLPADREYDGFDQSPVLLGTGPGPRDVFFYHSTKIGAQDLHTPGALMAVRKGAYKYHFYTQGSHCTDDFPDVLCHDSSRLAPASLLFNLERDPGEVNVLQNDTYGEFNATHTYASVVADLTALAKQHMDHFVSAPSQIGRGSSPSRFPCCTPCTPMPHCCACPV